MEKIDLDVFYRELDELFSKKGKKEIENYLLTHLRKAKIREDLPGETAVGNEMGGFYRAIGNNEKAMEIYERVLENIQTMGLENTEKHMAVLINIGSVQSNMGKWESALRRYLQGERILRGLSGDHTYFTAALYNNMSAALRNVGDLETAELVAEKALSLIQSMEQAHDEIATTYINLGEIAIKKGELAKARTQLNKAVSIFKEKKKKNSPHYPVALAGLGEINYLEGKKQEALLAYREALAVVEQKFGQSLDYHRLLENIRKVEETL